MESFEEVYQKYLKEVYCFLLRLSGDREIAEELTQQTFAIAFEKLENFRGECKISYYWAVVCAAASAVAAPAGASVDTYCAFT